MTNTTSENPWHNLKSLYILPEDFAAIAHHRNYSNLRLDALPSQVIGGLDRAEVIFLLLNPGFSEDDITVDLQLPHFIAANRLNHIDPYGSPFYYFNGDLERTAGYKWWKRVLNPLIQRGVTEAMLREKIMTIEYFPYHSKDWKDLPQVPSQQVAFDLVREAIKRKKTLIVRSPQRWLDAIPELATYPYVTFNSNLNVTVSPKNVGEANFDNIKNLIMGE